MTLTSFPDWRMAVCVISFLTGHRKGVDPKHGPDEDQAQQQHIGKYWFYFCHVQ